jgi:hypothetical protein
VMYSLATVVDSVENVYDQFENFSFYFYGW